MKQIKLNESERKYLIDILYSKILPLDDDINNLQDKIKDNLVLDNSDPTKEQIKDHTNYIKTLNKELKELKESSSINYSIIDKLKLKGIVIKND